MRQFSLKSAVLLLLTAIIWGSAFVAQSVGMRYIGPFTFNGTRSVLGALILLPILALFIKSEKAKDSHYRVGTKKDILYSGILCGVVMFVASNLQQFGIQYTTVGKAGFITAFYIVLVPILGIFVKRSCPPLVWCGVLLALVGLWFLCMRKESIQLQLGDLLLFLCAVVFAIHILIIDHYSPLVNGVLLSCIQFAICGVLSLLCAFLFEVISLPAILNAWQSILYAGILSCGVAYTLQILGQKNIDPTVGSLILSLESCISVLAGWVILKQTLSGRELFGCALMFFAVIFVQIVASRKAKQR